ncbi:hypothetical protein DFH07DRAFT_774278 [Mycena maculata]|uniref:CCHC-type domain-containing protein n=1 Tax=Mycena maculata TaxID=230809 RepID=A0AAD7IZM3_9AGAR|nr:hypothetical protein DFH07DRAFT_774278 [Mycena maculata]
MTQIEGGPPRNDQNSQQNQQPPPRERKTHTSDAVTDALKNLPRVNKLRKNTEIKGRNAERALQRAKHQDRPLLHRDASDDEPVITVSDDEEEQSPTSYLHEAKRGREDDEQSGERKAAKRIREEIILQPGMSLPVVFHDLRRHEVYTPLSLFTCPNLEAINSNAATLPLIKLNAPVPGDKQPRVLDTSTFELKYLKETDMDRRQWIEASRNYVSFIEAASGSDTSPESARWNSHFGFFQFVEEAETNYCAILATDIALRKKYISLPFVFDTGFYARELDKAIIDMKLNLMERKVTGGGPSGAPSDTYSGGSRGAPPFPTGSGGGAQATVCLICAKRGHYWNHCPSNSFADNTPLFSGPKGNNISASQSGQALCRAWNAKGPTASCTHDQAQRAHLCSFCGSWDHHTFSWSCRRNPPV